MKRILFHLLIIFGILVSNVHASQLDKISRVDSKDIVQLYFTFDTPPRFSDVQSSRRIDLIFNDSSFSPKLTMIDPDGKIVKILSRQSGDQLTLSLFFRYKPQKYTLKQSSDGNIVFEVLLGNEYSRTYQDLAKRLKGVTLLDRPYTNTTNPYIAVPYTKDWMSFFIQYESPIDLSIPVSFNLTPFPIVALLPPHKENNLSLFSNEMLALADQGIWDTLGLQILERIQNTKVLSKQKLLALTYGETLSRSGDFSGAYKQLYLLKDQFKEEIFGTFAAYLLAHLRCVHEDPFVGLQDYLSLDSLITPKNPLAPYFLLAKIDAALATGNLKTLNTLLLKDDVAFPPDVEEKVRIRQSDYWYSIRRPIQAFASYRLQLDSSALDRMPYSLTGLSNTLYKQKQYIKAARYYKKLAALLSDKDQLGLVTYRKNMADLKTEKRETLLDDFSQIELSFPGTEAGYRAALKKNDLLYLGDRNWARNAIANYTDIAQKSTIRSIREEALIKQAIIHTQLAENDRAITLLQQILREFQTGQIRTIAQALLIDVLPDQIKYLVDNKEYVQALVLAKQNRILFENNWLDNTFLSDIAKAYHRIGIYNEAQKLYLYLIGVAPVGQKEDFFLPMIEATFNHGSFSLVEEYAAQYFYNYPDGSYKDDILFMRLQSLVADERLNEAIKLLPIPLPDKEQFYTFAAPIYFRTDNYDKCLEILNKLKKINIELSGREQFFYAESLFLTQNFLEAMDNFKKIDKTNLFYEHSLYRRAELERQNGNEKKALTLFKKIVETGKDSRWIKYAQREIVFAEVSGNISF